MDDFIVLTKNEKLLRPTLYRIGGIGTPKLGTDRYFMLIKHVEAQYSKEIMKMSAKMDPNRNPNHLEDRWCILDAEGNERVEFKRFSHPYLVADSCIYSIDNTYLNIETGECCGKAYTSMHSRDFVFLETTHGDDPAKRGVMKISKKDGSWEVFA